MTKRWNFTGNVVGTDIVDETGIPYTNRGIVTNLNRLERENEQLKQLADGNEEQLLNVMTYLHDKYYDLWEEVNKECFKGDVE